MFVIISRKKFLSLLYLFFILFLIFGTCYSFAVSFTQRKENFSHLYENSEKIAYLSFDDGPSAKVTSKVLDILKEQNVKANFFLLGKQVEQFPELVKREYEEGHFLGNHGYSHNNATLYKSTDAFWLEVEKTDQAIGNAIGIPEYVSHIFRFPNGSKSKLYYRQKQKAIELLEEHEYVYIDWNALNQDSMKKYSKEALLQNLKNSSKGKGTLVILMHDTGDVNNTYDVLKDSIAYLKEQGYTFHTFDELL